jgi:ceramide glucosyltransferase
VTPAPAILALIGVLALLLIAHSHWRLVRGLTRRVTAPAQSAYPSITVVRPIRGLDVGAEANLDALFDLNYPGKLEIFCVLDSQNDPAFPVVRRAIERRSGGSRRIELLIAGAPPPGRTGKLNAMMLGARHATGELLAFNDSDTRPPREMLRTLVDSLLSNPRAGSAFAPIVAVADAPRAGDVGYGLLVNAWYSPAVALAAGPDGELPFIMGQFMVFRREALDAAGGLACAEGQLVDDMYIGSCVARAGWLNVMIAQPLPIVIGGMGIVQFLRTFRRWVLFSYGGLQPTFTRFNWARGAYAWAAWLSFAAALWLGHPAAAMAPALAIAAFATSQLTLQRRIGGSRAGARYAWIAAILPIAAALVALSTRISHRVDWRGRSYSLGRGARLGSGSASRAS